MYHLSCTLALSHVPSLMYMYLNAYTHSDLLYCYSWSQITLENGEEVQRELAAQDAVVQQAHGRPSAPRQQSTSSSADGEGPAAGASSSSDANAAAPSNVPPSGALPIPPELLVYVKAKCGPCVGNSRLGLAQVCYFFHACWKSILETSMRVGLFNKDSYEWLDAAVGRHADEADIGRNHIKCKYVVVSSSLQMCLSVIFVTSESLIESARVINAAFLLFMVHRESGSGRKLRQGCATFGQNHNLHVRESRNGSGVGGDMFNYYGKAIPEEQFDYLRQACGMTDDDTKLELISLTLGTIVEAKDEDGFLRIAVPRQAQYSPEHEMYLLYQRICIMFNKFVTSDDGIHKHINSVSPGLACRNLLGHFKTSPEALAMAELFGFAFVHSTYTTAIGFGIEDGCPVRDLCITADMLYRFRNFAQKSEGMLPCRRNPKFAHCQQHQARIAEANQKELKTNTVRSLDRVLADWTRLQVDGQHDFLNRLYELDSREFLELFHTKQLGQAGAPVAAQPVPGEGGAARGQQKQQGPDGAAVAKHTESHTESGTFGRQHLAIVLTAAFSSIPAMFGFVNSVKSRSDAFTGLTKSKRIDNQRISHSKTQMAESIAKCAPDGVSYAEELLCWLARVSSPVSYVIGVGIGFYLENRLCSCSRDLECAYRRYT